MQGSGQPATCSPGRPGQEATERQPGARGITEQAAQAGGGGGGGGRGRRVGPASPRPSRQPWVGPPAESERERAACVAGTDLEGQGPERVGVVGPAHRGLLKVWREARGGWETDMEMN